LQSGLKKAYKEVRLSNRKAHQKNKAHYKKAKERKFEVNDKVYLFCPARKPGRCHKFRSFWQGPFIALQILSDFSYKIMDKKGKGFVVHINHLKKSYNEIPWSFENAHHLRQKTRLNTETFDRNMVIQKRPIPTGDEREPQVVEMQALEEEQLQLDQVPQVPENAETPVADSNRRQKCLIPLYRIQIMNPQILHVPEELATTPIAPPITRSCQVTAAGEPSCVRANMTLKFEAVMRGIKNVWKYTHYD